MAQNMDKRSISTATYIRLYGYAPIEENNYSIDEEAAESMVNRIKANPIFDANTNHPRPCDCSLRQENKRCEEGSLCPTRRNGFNCGPQCEDFKFTPCMNRVVANEKFKLRVTIRAHRDIDIGLGLFAKEDISAGTYIGEVVGDLGMGDTLPNQYCFPLCDTQFKRAKDPELYLNLEHVGNEWRFLNASCDPNAKLLTVAVGLTLRLVVVATTLIRKDDEVTIKYTDQMLRFIETHECRVPGCHIREYMVKRSLQESPGRGVVRQAVVRHARHSRSTLGLGPNNIREELTDAKSSRIFFLNSGLGPIQGIGIHGSGFRKVDRGAKKDCKEQNQ